MSPHLPLKVGVKDKKEGKGEEWDDDGGGEVEVPVGGEDAELERHDHHDTVVDHESEHEDAAELAAGQERHRAAEAPLKEKEDDGAVPDAEQEPLEEAKEAHVGVSRDVLVELRPRLQKAHRHVLLHDAVHEDRAGREQHVEQHQ